MPVYVDADDIRQHLPQGRALSTEAIDELMEEQEYYVQTRLGLAALPPDNPTLKNIIRDMTVTAVIIAMSPAGSDNLTRAELQRREALRRLREVEADGLGVIGGVAKGDPLNDVYNPYPEPFFKASDFS